MSRSSDIATETVSAPGLGAGVIELADTAEIFGLLSDPGRLRMLAVLMDAESSVGRLADLAGLSESSASHALRLLRAHRIVQARRDGRMVYYRLADEHVRQLLLIALQHAEHSVLLHPEP
jgi:ArsR family transcriptional regulator, lead/cadmium/zinc/bismuth-responsive transcriptional repressor